MSAATEPRLEVQRELRDEVLHNYGSGRPIVAIDGVDAAGTADFADGLAAAFAEVGRAVVRASASGFPAGGDGSGPLDEAILRSALVTPFRAGGDSAFRTAADAAPQTSPVDAVLLLDGPFLHSPELVGIWNYSIFLEVPGASAPEEQRRYLATVRPRTRAVAIIDNTDPERPVRRFADSC
jgi:uridine kinase